VRFVKGSVHLLSAYFIVQLDHVQLFNDDMAVGMAVDYNSPYLIVNSVVSYPPPPP
jgi:hypothetical protein